jgi:lysozyme family protein
MCYDTFNGFASRNENLKSEIGVGVSDWCVLSELDGYRLRPFFGYQHSGRKITNPQIILKIILISKSHILQLIVMAVWNS